MPTTTHFFVPRRRVSPLASLGWSDFDRVFDQLWNGAGRASTRGEASVAPRIDFSESDTEIVVAAELPGLEAHCDRHGRTVSWGDYGDSGGAGPLIPAANHERAMSEPA